MLMGEKGCQGCGVCTCGKWPKAWPASTDGGLALAGNKSAKLILRATESPWPSPGLLWGRLLAGVLAGELASPERSLQSEAAPSASSRSPMPVSHSCKCRRQELSSRSNCRFEACVRGSGVWGCELGRLSRCTSWMYRRYSGLALPMLIWRTRAFSRRACVSALDSLPSQTSRSSSTCSMLSLGAMDRLVWQSVGEPRRG
mmetsp:Transcript_19560/g.54689  ORF Transcript_19560/g.54689 Transcript_19560/m.54689 type:complete len:200 (+) Transcript_19560:869-1468(+)